MTEFERFSKVPRLNRDCIITEKIDGTNAQVLIATSLIGATITEPIWRQIIDDVTEMCIWAGSRSRWLNLQSDNMGFAAWVFENGKELLELGAGRHFGEWWGQKIQRNYGLDHKVFSLFNTVRWNERMFKMFKHEPWKLQEERRGARKGTVAEPVFTRPPECCRVVPVIGAGPFKTHVFEGCLAHLKHKGSTAAPGFMNPEGIMVFHTGANHGFKITFEGDDSGKEWGA